jgi:hypothetical protein
MDFLKIIKKRMFMNMKEKEPEIFEAKHNPN